MALTSQVSLKINKPAQDVFEAIVDPEKISQYFTTNSSARMETGKTIVWYWKDANAECEVKVIEAIPSQSITLQWAASGDENCTVEMTLEALSDNLTQINVTEGKWTCDEAGAKKLNQQTGGWMHMLLCMKAYLEYGINLRDSAVCG